MKKPLIFITLLLLLFKFDSSAQKAKITSDFNLSVIMPESVNKLDESQLSKLETKIIRIAEASGITATGEFSNFIIYPKFEVYESGIIEGGMQNIVTTNNHLSIFIKQVDNNIIFSSITKTFKGSGNSESSSLTNAISNINVNDKEFKKFLDTGKEKIIKYYDTKCSSILLNAENLVKRNDYQQAIALTAQIPEGTNCYLTAQTKLLFFYKLYKNSLCSETIRNVNISLASNNYSDAISYLSEIEPNSTCAAEARILLKKIETKINAEEKRDYDTKIKKYNDEVSMQKQRISAIRDIAVSYYKNKPAVTYNYIVR